MPDDQLHDALKSANEICRSAFQIANRDGQATNWEAFRGQVHKSLALQHRVMYPQQYRPFDDEALLRDMPADTTEEQAIAAAVEWGSWA